MAYGTVPGMDSALTMLLAQAPGFGYGDKPTLQQQGTPKRPKRSTVSPQNAQGISTSPLGRRYMLGYTGMSRGM